MLTVKRKRKADVASKTNETQKKKIRHLHKCYNWQPMFFYKTFNLDENFGDFLIPDLWAIVFDYAKEDKVLIQMVHCVSEYAQQPRPNPV